LHGEDGADILRAGLGDDYMDGGAGADIFRFEAGAGADRIARFDADRAGGQDRIDLSSFGFGSYDAMLAAGVTIAPSGVDTVLDLETGNPVVTLLGMVRSAIDAFDFVF